MSFSEPPHEDYQTAAATERVSEESSHDTAEWRSEFQKRRHAFEREPSNIQLLNSPGMVFGHAPQRGVASGPSRDSPTNRNARRNEEVPTVQDLAIGEETGQKEQVFHEPQNDSHTRRGISPSLLNQSEDSEHDGPLLSQQIAVLTMQNEQLQKQLFEREAEKDRLSKQLEQKTRSVYSPPGLPSRILDGRKVLRDSLPLSITPPLSHSSRPLTPTSPLHMLSPRLPPSSPLLSPRLPSTSPLLPSGGYSSEFGSEVKGELGELRRINRHLEQKLLEVSEEKRRLEIELGRQRDNLVKIQEREQDLTQDIETLRTENSHHTGDIFKLKTERDSLKSSNTSFHTQLSTLSDKLSKTEKCYSEVEQENLSLEADIEQLNLERKQLYQEREKLQSAVEDALKTKENYRSTIRQLRDENVALEGRLRGSAEQTEVKVQSSPVTKGQQVLSEVMSLRQEKTHLKGKLQDAQHEIDSLEAHLKDQEDQDFDVLKFRNALSAHLVGFQNQVDSISQGLEMTRDVVAKLTSEQKAMVHDGFLLLAKKCREELAHAAEDKGQLAETLASTEISLVALRDDYEKLREENSKLVNLKSSVTSDVSKLRSEILSLQDQRKMLEVQLSQNEVISQQKDEQVKSLQEEKSTLENRYKTSEKCWKNEFVRLEREWEGRVAEATQAHELLLDSKESLESEKNSLEVKLSRVQLENHQLSIVKEDLEAQVVNIQERLNDMTEKFSEKADTISRFQVKIASLLSQKALLSAELRIEKEVLERKLAKVTHEKEELMTDKDSEALTRLEVERKRFQSKLGLVVEKETEVDLLTSRVAVLTNEKEQLFNEKKLLNESRLKATQEIQLLVESEEKRQLETEKLKMTLTTEIELLKSKLKMMEEKKELETSSKDKIVVSAFQPVPQIKHIEQLRQQIASLQLENKEKRRAINHDSTSSRLALAELQSRLSGLEVENSKLKEVARGNQQSVEDMTTLRKQVSELTRKGFFLESEKKQLTDKLHTAHGNLKLAREMKDRLAADRMQTLQDNNQILLERVRSLEGSLTKKMMSADLKIVETVRENDKLRQKLVQIYTLLEAEKKRMINFEKLVTSLKERSSVLTAVQLALSEVKSSGLQLESSPPPETPSQKKSSTTSLKQIDSDTGRSVTFVRSVTTTGGASTPPLSKSLPPKLQGGLGVTKSLPPGFMPTPQESPVTIATNKLDQLQQRNEELSTALTKQQEILCQFELKISAIGDDYSQLIDHLEQSLASSREMCETLSGFRETEMKTDQLKMIKVLQDQVESLQDQVIDRDYALQDIELQMKKDYGLHDKKFASLKSQVLELREQLSAKDDQLRTKDQYIQQMEEKHVACENQLYQTRKELERDKRELLAQALPESIQRQFASGQSLPNIPDVIKVQGEEIHQLQKVVREFSYGIGQLQGQLDSTQRDKGMLQSKTIELERMHIQMKEAMTADINYLRKLNLQLVEQQMKTEKATEILKEVKGAQEAFRQQRDVIKMEAELDSSKLTVHEQSRKISELECQLANQNIAIKLLQAEKDHAFLLTQHAKDLTNQIGGRSTGYLRPHSADPRSAESARRPNYRISDSKSRLVASGRKPLQVGEFSIPFPIGQGVDILNLEEQPEPFQSHIPLGPTVVTDDEYATLADRDAKTTKQPRPLKSRMRGHRRTASTGSNILPPSNESSNVSGDSGETTSHPPVVLPGKQKGAGSKYPRRPGSAGSTRHDVRVINRMASPEHVTKTARELSDYVNNLIDESNRDDNFRSLVQEMGGAKSEPKHSPIRGRTTSLGGVPLGSSKLNYSGVSHLKVANKSTDSNETTSSSEGKSSSSQSDSGANPVTNKLPMLESTNQDHSLAVDSTPISSDMKQLTAPDLSRTESMSSSSSIFHSLLPSRTGSFVYDGGESSPYESVEIGDSVENLQTLTKLGYYPYMLPIHRKNETTSSSDDDYPSLIPSRRKRSSGAGNEGSHDTPRHIKDMSDNSNSSCDSDQLQLQGSYHGNKASNQRGGIPVHRNDSISISDMENYSTDVDAVQKKAADLHAQYRFAQGRMRYSSTGSVKICYSASSNTSLEDIRQN